MKKGEDSLVAWIASRYPARGKNVPVGIGDDMAILRTTSYELRASPHEPEAATHELRTDRRDADAPQSLRAAGRDLLVAADMLMDGVHFDASVHSPEQIGRKAMAVNLSDCAAMAVRPCYVVVSVALPNSWTMAQAQGLFLGMEALARRYDCAIVGGDTNSWSRPLVINVAVIAEPWKRRDHRKRREKKDKKSSAISAVSSAVEPVRRSGMVPGDIICVTGRLGGSRLGHHLDFEPRVFEGRALAEGLGPALHAMIDLSDGLSTDSRRLAAASGCGIEFNSAALEGVVSEAAVEASGKDGRSPLEHLFDDGEDFELLFAVDPEAAVSPEGHVQADTKTGQRAGLSQAGSARQAGSLGRGLLEAVSLPCSGTRIGLAIDQGGVWLTEPDGRPLLVKAGGWEHWKDEG